MKKLQTTIALLLTTAMLTCLLSNATYAQSQWRIKSRYSVIMVKTRAEAMEMLFKLDQEADFGELAKQFSVGPNRDIGGDLGYLLPEDLSMKVRTKASELIVGKYSRVIDLGSRYAILIKTDTINTEAKMVGPHSFKAKPQNFSGLRFSDAGDFTKPMNFYFPDSAFVGRRRAATTNHFFLPELVYYKPSRNLGGVVPYLPRVMSGRIELFETEEHRYLSGGSYPTRTSTYHRSFNHAGPVSGPYSTTRTYFSKYGGPLQDASYENLKVALADNPESLRYLHKSRKFYYCSTALLPLGSLVTLSGIAMYERRQTATGTRLVGGGLSAVLLGLIMEKLESDSKKRAIEIYNKRTYSLREK